MRTPLWTLVMGALVLVSSVDARRIDDVAYTPGYALDLVVPEGPGLSRPWPVIVLLHGGSYLAGDKRDLRLLADELGRRGIASVTPNFRLGVPDARTEIETQNYVYPNILSTFGWIADHGAAYHLDSQRVFVAGASSGGHMAMGAGILYPREARPRIRLRGAISLYGGTFAEGIEPRSLPLLILQGLDDRSCLPEASRRMATLYRVAGARCRLVLIEGMGHEWSGTGFAPVVDEIAAFVRNPDLSLREDERLYRKGL